MAKPLEPFAESRHLALGPPVAKVVARGRQLRRQLVEKSLVPRGRSRCAQARDVTPRENLPVPDQRSAGLVEKQEANRVALVRLERAVVDEQPRHGPVPGQDVETAVAHVSRDRIHGVDHGGQAVADVLRPVGVGRQVFGQGQQMPVFHFIELQDRRDAPQSLDGNLDVAALLDPGIPADADTGEDGHLFPPQARGASVLGGNCQAARLHGRALAGQERTKRFSLLRRRLTHNATVGVCGKAVKREQSIGSTVNLIRHRSRSYNLQSRNFIRVVETCLVLGLFEIATKDSRRSISRGSPSGCLRWRCHGLLACRRFGLRRTLRASSAADAPISAVSQPASAERKPDTRK